MWFCFCLDFFVLFRRNCELLLLLFLLCRVLSIVRVLLCYLHFLSASHSCHSFAPELCFFSFFPQFTFAALSLHSPLTLTFNTHFTRMCISTFLSTFHPHVYLHHSLHPCQATCFSTFTFHLPMLYHVRSTFHLHTYLHLLPCTSTFLFTIYLLTYLHPPPSPFSPPSFLQSLPAISPYNHSL